MCLINRITEVKKFLKNKAGQEFVWGFKVLRVEDRKVLSPYLPSVWKAGWKKSDSRAKLCMKNWKEIERGIHVCRNLARADSLQKILYYKAGITCVKVKCYLSDLIGANGNDLVFRKVYLPATEYAKVLKG